MKKELQGVEDGLMADVHRECLQEGSIPEMITWGKLL